ncbi:helix-turn-helix domain-containing protein [Streptomyces sp. NPDC017868]|uniref:helix-turn-helix domain-containing protein n=1 Tax=Streptomyces sp. NPDC017868 TaxID=3365014 RepID=UPI0037AA5255
MTDARPQRRRLALTLRRVQQERGLSQRALARLLHLSSHTSVGDGEHARRVPSDDILGRYERRLGLPEGELRVARRELLAAEAVRNVASAVASAAAETAAVARASTRPAASTAPRTAPVRPTTADLPPAPSDFSGRADDVAELRTLLTARHLRPS